MVFFPHLLIIVQKPLLVKCCKLTRSDIKCVLIVIVVASLLWHERELFLAVSCKTWKCTISMSWYTWQKRIEKGLCWVIRHVLLVQWLQWFCRKDCWKRCLEWCSLGWSHFLLEEEIEYACLSHDINGPCSEWISIGNRGRRTRPDHRWSKYGCQVV